MKRNGCHVFKALWYKTSKSKILISFGSWMILPVMAFSILNSGLVTLLSYVNLLWIYVVVIYTFFRGASLGGSRITISHDSCLERELFINSVASSLRNDILSGFKLLSTTFSLANSKAGNEVSTPVGKRKIMHITYKNFGVASNNWFQLMQSIQ